MFARLLRITLLALAGYTSASQLTAETVRGQLIALQSQCDDLVDPVSTAVEPQEEAVAALRACFQRRAYEYAWVIGNATQAISIKGLSGVKETDCLARLPMALAVLQHGFAYYGSIHDHPVEKAYKRAMDTFSVEMGYYLNDYTCLNQLNLTELAYLLDRGLELFYRESDKDTQNEATRKKMPPEFPFLDFKMSVDTRIIQRANQEYEKDSNSPDEEEREKAERKFRAAISRRRFRLPAAEEARQAQYLELRTKLPYNPGTAGGNYVVDELGYIIPEDELTGNDPVSKVLRRLGIDPLGVEPADPAAVAQTTATADNTASAATPSKGKSKQPRQEL